MGSDKYDPQQCLETRTNSQGKAQRASLLYEQVQGEVWSYYRDIGLLAVSCKVIQREKGHEWVWQSETVFLLC